MQLLALHPPSPPAYVKPVLSTMQLLTIILSALSLATVALGVPASGSSAQTQQVTYDPVYDKKSNSLDIVACSNGKHGLETKGTSP